VLLREPNTEGLVDLVTRELQTAEWIWHRGFPPIEGGRMEAAAV